MSQGAQKSELTLHLAAYMRPPENVNADALRLPQRGEQLLADLRKLVRSDPTFGGRATTHIAESRLLSGASNDGSFDDVGVYVVQPIRLVVYWTDPDHLDIAIEAVVKACKGIKRSAGYKHSVKYVSRNLTDPDELQTDQIPAVWVVRDLGATEELTYIDGP